MLGAGAVLGVTGATLAASTTGVALAGGVVSEVKKKTYKLMSDK